MDGGDGSSNYFSYNDSNSSQFHHKREVYRSKESSRRVNHRDRQDFDDEEYGRDSDSRKQYEKRHSMKRRHAKTGGIPIKSEDPEDSRSPSSTSSSGGGDDDDGAAGMSPPPDYLNKKIKVEPRSPKYSSGKEGSTSTKHKASRWETEGSVAANIKKEPKPRTHSESRSPSTHHHHHHHRGHHHQQHQQQQQQYHHHHNSNRNNSREESLSHNRSHEDRKREKDYKRKNAKEVLKGSNNNNTDNGNTAGGGGADAQEPPKAEANMELSGKLTEHSNTYNGIVIKYNEPAEARKPKRRWRLYPFKGSEELPMLPIHRQSAYLIGRERLVADIPVGHPSISKQHAILQFRKVQFKRVSGTIGYRVRPYLLDLNSSNGTYINCKKIKPQCYVELFEKDLIKFGYSTREYILLHEESNTVEVESADKDEVSD
ncbi:FHA domain-containing protein DDL-like [Argonauta hians]